MALLPRVITLDALILLPTFWAISFFAAFSLHLPFHDLLCVFPFAFAALYVLVLYTLQSGKSLEAINPRDFILALGSSVLFYYLIDNAGVNLSWHGTFHSHLIYEILNGKQSLTNANFHLAPVNFYWVYHSWLAMICSIFEVNPFRASALSNAYFLFVTILALAPIVKDKCRVGAIAATTLVWIVLCWQPPLLKIVPIPEEWLAHLRELFVIPRLGIFNKFWNFNGFPPGIAVATYFLNMTLRDTPTVASKNLVTGTAGAGVLLLHPTSFVLVAVQIFADSAYRLIFQKVYAWKMPLIFAGIFVAGCLLYIQNITATLGKPTVLGVNHYGIALFIKVEYLKALLLLFVIGRIDLKERWQAVMLITYFVLLLLTFLVHLPDGNEYKFVMFMCLMSALLFAILAFRMPLSPVTASTLVVGAVIGLFQAGLDHQPWWKRPVEHGKHYLISKVPEDEELYRFIRKNTSSSAVFHVRGLRWNEHFQLVFTGRSNFIVQDRLHTNFPNYDRICIIANWKTEAQMKRFVREAQKYDFPLYYICRVCDKVCQPQAVPAFSNGKYRLYPINAKAELELRYAEGTRTIQGQVSDFSEHVRVHSEPADIESSLKLH